MEIQIHSPYGLMAFTETSLAFTANNLTTATKLHIVTEKSAVDLGSVLRWEELAVSCL
jgi:hypothetical protein